MWRRRDTLFVIALLAIFVGGVAVLSTLIQINDWGPVALVGVFPIAAVWLVVFFKWIPIRD